MRDSDVFAEMAKQINDTGKFTYVRWGKQDAETPAKGATVQIVRLGWDRPAIGQDSDREDMRVLFRITLIYNNPDVMVRNERVFEFEGIIINMFHHKSIGGMTISNRTVCDKARDKLDFPAGAVQVLIDGYFTYNVSFVNPIES
jgi:hypothetical protein